jgi:hypothetical protein
MTMYMLEESIWNKVCKVFLRIYLVVLVDICLLVVILLHIK